MIINKFQLIRKIYLYLLSLFGCVLITIGFISLINQGFKAYIFTEADREQEFYSYPIPRIPLEEQKLNKASEGTEILTQEEQELLRQYLNDYKQWEEKNKNIDVIKARRHKSVSMSLSLILVGFPIYLFHWAIIKRENKKEK